MQEVAFDVKTEPGLQTLSRNKKLTPGTKTEDNARLDKSARRIFSSHELTFFKKKGGALTQHTQRKKNAGSDKMSGVLSEGSPLECYTGLYLALHS